MPPACAYVQARALPGQRHAQKGLPVTIPAVSKRILQAEPSAHRRGVASEGMGSPSSYSATMVPPLRRSSMITAPAAASAAQDVR
jgi:hypothetical protein